MQIFLAALFLGSLAAALLAPGPTRTLFTRDSKFAAQLIQEVMPKSASCAGAAEPDQCRTAAQAAEYFVTGFQDYEIRTAAEIAGILALVALESVELQYKINIAKGRTGGQGTSNMQMAKFNIEYAKGISELADKVDAAGEAGILDLVTDDRWNFGTGPWYYSTYCSEDVKTALKTGTDEGFKAYMGCVGVEVTEERAAYWNNAKTAFGL